MTCIGSFPVTLNASRGLLLFLEKSQVDYFAKSLIIDPKRIVILYMFDQLTVEIFEIQFLTKKK